MDEIGAYGFDDEGEKNIEGFDTEDDEDENEASKKSMDICEYKLMRKNEALM
jgi:hypothetical protein